MRAPIYVLDGEGLARPPPPDDGDDDRRSLMLQATGMLSHSFGEMQWRVDFSWPPRFRYRCFACLHGQALPTSMTAASIPLPLLRVFTWTGAADEHDAYGLDKKQVARQRKSYLRGQEVQDGEDPGVSCQVTLY